jgi:hypothetical protein
MLATDQRPVIVQRRVVSRPRVRSLLLRPKRCTGRLVDLAKRLHQSLIGNLETFREEMRNGALVERELFDFLARWLKGHIVGVDQSSASFSRSATITTR